MNLREGNTATLRRLIEVAVLVVITVGAAGVAWAMWPTAPFAEPLPNEPVNIAQAPVAGSASAPIIVIEYADFQCPFCAQFWQKTLPAIQARFVRTGQIRLVFKHLPLESIHPLSLGAAEAAECAFRQGKFWEIHDQLFAAQNQLDRGALIQRASTLGLDQASFRECLASDNAVRVHGDAAEAKSFDITATPTFLIGHMRPDGRVQATERLSGAVGEQDFRSAVDKALGHEGPVWRGVLAVLIGGLLAATGAIAWARRRRMVRLATR